jgi:hypothetical protein
MHELILKELLLLGVEEKGLLAGCCAVTWVVAGPLSVVLIHYDFFLFFVLSLELSGFAKTLSFLFY